ncbi:MAG: hypothetical protein U9Q68_08275 [Euryarchaeota archaeon]|nr:hypothetical protein [Euryarchaeota archaeon]
MKPAKGAPGFTAVFMIHRVACDRLRDDAPQGVGVSTGDDG